MAFICPTEFNCSLVSFYLRDDFRKELDVSRCCIDHYIEKGDTNAQIYYIRKYMDTNIPTGCKRPDTPAKLIMPRISKYYEPLF
jgi:hypothetical protein